MQILVDHLGELTGAHLAHEPAGAGIGGDDRLDAGVGLRRAAAHHGEDALLGAGLAAGDRRVDEGGATRLGGLGQLARHGGGGGGVVDEDGTRVEALEGAAGGGRDTAQVVVVADAGEDDLGPLGRRGWRRGRRVAVRFHPGSGAARRSVVDGHGMSLGGEMTRHGIAHHAEPDECHARHAFSP